MKVPHGDSHLLRMSLTESLHQGSTQYLLPQTRVKEYALPVASVVALGHCNAILVAFGSLGRLLSLVIEVLEKRRGDTGFRHSLPASDVLTASSGRVITPPSARPHL